MLLNPMHSSTLTDCDPDNKAQLMDADATMSKLNFTPVSARRWTYLVDKQDMSTLCAPMADGPIAVRIKFPLGAFKLVCVPRTRQRWLAGIPKGESSAIRTYSKSGISQLRSTCSCSVLLLVGCCIRSTITSTR
jgi:hypothetical protein